MACRSIRSLLSNGWAVSLRVWTVGDGQQVGTYTRAMLYGWRNKAKTVIATDQVITEPRDRLAEVSWWRVLPQACFGVGRLAQLQGPCCIAGSTQSKDFDMHQTGNTPSLDTIVRRCHGEGFLSSGIQVDIR